MDTEAIPIPSLADMRQTVENRARHVSIIFDTLLVPDKIIAEADIQTCDHFDLTITDNRRRAIGARHDLDVHRRLTEEVRTASNMTVLRQYIEEMRELTANAVANSPFFRHRVKIFAKLDEMFTK